MPAPVLTYNEFINLVKSWIKTNCVNIANFASISAEFKSGYSTPTTVVPHTGGGSTPTARAEISTYVSQVSESTVDTDMTNFINSLPTSINLNDSIKSDEYLDLVNNMISFCSTKMCFTVSQYSSNKYLIYYTGNTTFSPKYQLSSDINQRLIYASDANTILSILKDTVTKTIRSVPCKYNLILS